MTLNNRDFEKVTEGHSIMVPFEILGAVSYLPSIVTMAVSLTVSEIFSVKKGVTFKQGVGVVQGH